MMEGEQGLKDLTIIQGQTSQVIEQTGPFNKRREGGG